MGHIEIVEKATNKVVARYNDNQYHFVAHETLNGIVNIVVCLDLKQEIKEYYDAELFEVKHCYLKGSKLWEH